MTAVPWLRPRRLLLFSAVLALCALSFCPRPCEAKKRRGRVAKEKRQLHLHSPDQTSEETLDLDTPEDMKCDACVGVAAVYATALWNAELRVEGKRKRLTETQYLDIMERVCDGTDWVEEFGVVPGYGGRNYLVGPGLEEPPLDPNKEDVNAVVTRRGEVLTNAANPPTRKRMEHSRHRRCAC